MLKNFVILFFVGITVLTVNGQPTNFNTQRNWSMNKKELNFGFGATNFLGDLGGANQIGTDYSIKDWDFPATSLGGSFAFRYRFHPYYATSTIINFGVIRGNDLNTKDPVREQRNLHFRAPFINISQRYEYVALAKEKIGRRFNIPGLRGFKDHNEQLYLFTGIGVMWFNPKAQLNGSWVPLQPLSTAGQGLPGGPENYSRVTATIPFGIGMRMGINRFWRVGLEFSYIKTFSDYLDDVSGDYYDAAEILALKGPDAAYLSNPSPVPQNYAGYLRGDKEKDAMFYMNLIVTRNITYQKIGQRSSRVRFGKYRAKF